MFVYVNTVGNSEYPMHDKPDFFYFDEHRDIFSNQHLLIS